jgi:hypothetical protein
VIFVLIEDSERSYSAQNIVTDIIATIIASKFKFVVALVLTALIDACNHEGNRVSLGARQLNEKIGREQASQDDKNLSNCECDNCTRF